MTPEQLISVVDDVVHAKDVLDHLGWPYRGLPGQTRCPVHKGGDETTASARVYPEGALWCYTCGRHYRATEIYSARRRVERVRAAEVLVDVFHVTVKQQQDALRHVRTPRRIPVNEALIRIAQDSLLKYKHKVPLNIYRAWAERVDGLHEHLTGITPEEQQQKLFAFKRQLTTELRDAATEK